MCIRRPFVVLLAAAIAACGGGGDKGSTGPSAPPASISFVAGSGQTVRINSAAPTNPGAKVLDQNGAAVSGATVTFAVSGGGGSVANTSAVTGSDGVASPGAWTMGTATGDNALTATVSTSITATLHATARYPRWTYMVYMAADNNLTMSGLGDIEEMEAAGADPEVQVVVQAEFNPQEFSLRNCTAACAHLPNFNTFRYAIMGVTPNVDGPNGTVTDIGNRSMTDPAQLKEFVNWARATYPAEKFGLVLWNHGGGYTGLLEDLTSTGSKSMSLEELKTALTGTGELDVLNFDMCLMAGYETLTKLTGLAKVAVFSEETEPGDGDPYTPIIDALQADPSMDAKALGTAIVNAYNASYATPNNKASTTKSAFDLSAFAAFETALGTLAGTLTTNVSVLSSAIGTSATVSQKYEIPQLTDLLDFLDSLNVRTTDNTVKTQIAAVKTAASAAAFRLNSKARNGADAGARRVARSTGLHVLMPSKTAFDELPASGPASFAAYQALYSGKPWTTFLAAWLTGSAAQKLVDQGENRYQVYLVWDSLGKSKGVDVDLWILEPSGDLFIPWKGTVTPNGLLTDDSQVNGVAYEGYETNRYVEPGDYKFYANLYADPQTFKPKYDIVYRNNQTSSFASLYSPNFPILSLQTSWLNDPTPTFAEADAGAYTDLRLAAVLNIPPPPAAAAGDLPSASRPAGRLPPPTYARVTGSLSRMGGSDSAPAALQAQEPHITAAQLATIRSLYEGGKLNAMRSIAATRPRAALRTTAHSLNTSRLRSRLPGAQ